MTVLHELELALGFAFNVSEVAGKTREKQEIKQEEDENSVKKERTWNSSGTLNKDF